MRLLLSHTVISCYLALCFFFPILASSEEAEQCPCAIKDMYRCPHPYYTDLVVAHQQLNFIHHYFDDTFQARHRDFSLPTIVLVDQGTLKSLCGYRSNGAYLNNTIYLNQNLTRSQSFGTIAHEYAHYWQSYHHLYPSHISNFLKEGFCEWVAYRLTQAVGLKEQANNLYQNQHPVYGDGLRWYLKQEECYNQAHVFNIALKWLDESGITVSGLKPGSYSVLKP